MVFLCRIKLTQIIWVRCKRIVRPTAPFKSVHLHQFCFDRACFFIATSGKCFTQIICHSIYLSMRICRWTSWLIIFSIESFIRFAKSPADIPTCGILFHCSKRSTEGFSGQVHWRWCMHQIGNERANRSDSPNCNQQFYSSETRLILNRSLSNFTWRLYESNPPKYQKTFRNNAPQP